jgi:uncharacterized repeat protein (TIGR03803 family)
MTRDWVRHLTIAALALLAAALTPFSSAKAWTLTTLYSFCAVGHHCRDGSNPDGPLLLGADGTLYGTTQFGGRHRLRGTIFALIPGAHGHWKFHQLYRFCLLDPKCPDGASPSGGLIMDSAGNLYGVTDTGGTTGSGTVYELSPPVAGSKDWNETVLYNFDNFDFPDGRLTYAGAQSGALYDGTSPLYGTAPFGGANDSGSAYSLALSHGAWSKKTLHDFCSLSQCADGDGPSGDLLIDAGGTLYGVTTALGLGESGTAYEISGSTFQVLHTFCSQAGCSDPGGGPAGLIRDDAGNFYSTSLFGGGGCKPLGCGVVYQLSPDGKNETVLYNFCTLPKCADGHGSDAELLPDGSGGFFGTAVHGGDKDDGTVFQLSGKSLQVLHSFCAKSNCADGATPESALIADGSGRLFGVTREGGAFGNLDAHTGGTVFMLTP